MIFYLIGKRKKKKAQAVAMTNEMMKPGHQAPTHTLEDGDNPLTDTRSTVERV